MLLVFLVGCTNSSNTESKNIKEILNDSTMFDIRLGEHKAIVIAKLKRAGYYDLGYKFLDERLDGIRFYFSTYGAFHNDSLVDFTVKTRDIDNFLGKADTAYNALVEIYTVKYGDPHKTEKKSCYWYGKEKTISISKNDFDNDDEWNLHISYYRPDRHQLERYEITEDYNTYSKDYWDMYYKSESDSIKESNFRKIQSDI